MKALSLKEPWVVNTLERLLALPASTRRALLEALRHSLEPAKNKDRKPLSENEKDRLFWSSFGGWKGDGTADEQIAKIRNSRNFTRTRENL
jgi:hypothetical protein